MLGTLMILAEVRESGCNIPAAVDKLTTAEFGFTSKAVLTACAHLWQAALHANLPVSITDTTFADFTPQQRRQMATYAIEWFPTD